jgi:DNA ligase-1
VRAFAELIEDLDHENATSEKRAALLRYLKRAPDADAAQALHLLLGGRVAKVASATELLRWIAAASNTPEWLVAESYAAVGDLAETLSLLADEPEQAIWPPALSAQIAALEALKGAEASVREAYVTQCWQQLSRKQRFVFNKLMTGAFRVGVSKGLMQQALAEHSGLDVARIAERMMAKFKPTAANYRALIDPAQAGDQALPLPFFLASALEHSTEHLQRELGHIGEWQLEWKWDGIRLQALKTGSLLVLYSRGEARLDGRFPELEQALAELPDGSIIDGELLAFKDGKVLPFLALQRRIQKLKPSARLLSEVPTRLVAYDLLKDAGVDIRASALSERRARLEAIVQALASPGVIVSEVVEANSWADADQQRGFARTLGTEGLMLKRRSSSYQIGRKRGDWWKWKIAPLSIDAVLIYSQAGHGRRAGLHTDHTFALWHEGRLLPVAKAYSGLDDKEMQRLDQWIRAHTEERFGPVRRVTPLQVFEIAFEAVQASSRHKSGVAVRFPRIVRWRIDKTADQANSLDELRALATA